MGGEPRQSPDDLPPSGGASSLYPTGLSQPTHCPRLGIHGPGVPRGGESLGAISTTVDSAPETAACVMGRLGTQVRTCKAHRASVDDAQARRERVTNGPPS